MVETEDCFYIDLALVQMEEILPRIGATSLLQSRRSSRPLEKGGPSAEINVSCFGDYSIRGLLPVLYILIGKEMFGRVVLLPIQ